MLSVRKWAHIALTALGAAYLAFVFFSKGLMAVMNNHSLPVFLYLVSGVVIFVLFYVLLHQLSRRRLVLFCHAQTRSRLSPAFFSLVTLLTFAFYFSYLLASHPGGFSSDTSWQWTQAHSMAFTDHHPVFHTLLFCLLTSIWDNYTFMLLIQIAAFACAMGYLAATMLAWGFRQSLILVFCAVCCLAKPTRHLMVYFWKDTTMSILMVFFLAHIFNIFLSKGDWLKMRGHWLASALLLAVITLVRHNAILLTAPLMGLMFIYLSGVRKACLKMIAAVLLLVIGVKGPLYSCLNIDTEKATYLETTGLPMTILCSAYVYAPENMPLDAYMFMERFQDQKTAAEYYEFGNYNSFKWTCGLDYAQAEEKMRETPIGEFLGFTWETIKAEPLLSIHSVLELTDIVWDPLGPQINLVDPPSGKAPETISIPEKVTKIFAFLFRQADKIFDRALIQKPLTQLGFLSVLLLLACYVSIHQVRGWASLWLVVPVLCYNFGTMLLLSGPDYRFFHFNCLITFPLIALLLSRPKETENETCKSR